ncbi:MAG: hypothetical protein ABIL09_12615 [Gemmatimonadota bacterium]
METEVQVFGHGSAQPIFLLATAITAIRDIFHHSGVDASLDQIAAEAVSLAKREAPNSTWCRNERTDPEDED